ncbi:MAG TPA: L-seryl-tRNA(Sec) selenium transferase [Oligoflexia bacterium]|nr:L-seryl-tRNA(Sec) selenium transferase [Oligoflexia bacterium]HMP47479.1 L-seryl-tRNA(Sec) selenium transferase [Oligoflexia bacterium]
MNKARFLPSISSLIEDVTLSDIRESIGTGVFSALSKKALEILRLEIQGESVTEQDLDQSVQKSIILSKVKNEILKLSRILPPATKEAINGTGILLHTGLGRAPLANNSILSLAAGYNAVQIDRQNGTRSLREEYIELLLRELVSAESTTVVNNNAAATFLVLKSLFKGKEVIISRGHLVEIGGSYRMPDIMSESGCIMREVGTTNKTHIKDYISAINENTGAIVFVHQSNFKIHGFSSIPSLKEICELGKSRSIPVFADLGSGSLVDLTRFGLPHELSIKEVIAAGASVCCFSGDKLLGGPQAGIICGKKQFIEKIRNDPFSRMFRVCKLTLRLLEDSLESFINSNYLDSVPLYSLLNVTQDELKTRANNLCEKLQDNISNLSKESESSYKFSVKNTNAFMGGGSSADASIESYSLTISFTDEKLAGKIAEELRFQSPGIFGRVSDGKVFIDFRGVFKTQDEQLYDGIINCLSTHKSC